MLICNKMNATIRIRHGIDLLDEPYEYIVDFAYAMYCKETLLSM